MIALLRLLTDGLALMLAIALTFGVMAGLRRTNKAERRRRARC